SPLSSQAYLLSGHIGVIDRQKSFSGSLTWRHLKHQDVVLILSPLGQGVARIVRNDKAVVLETADGKKWVSGSARALTQRILGWPLPIKGLHYWVMGQPAPGQALTRLNQAGQLVHLEQEGWIVDYSGYSQQGQVMLPSRLILKGPEVKVKLIIDRWAPA
ncbi:MAG: outer membrane lipoprotein LolB, partial [Pseudomonadota bacterium]|nr:outer membrane lipoprotein LolB [Pseudomonadota bacterium]